MATYDGIKKIKIGNNVFNLYDSGNSGGTITSIKTTAGAHTAINVTSGAVSFNVPTTAAHVGIKFGYTTSGNNRAVQQDSSGNLYVTQKDDNSNTTYTLSGALSSHKFTSTLTAGGSGSGTSTSALTLAAGSNVTLTDNTSTKTITIAATDTKYSAGDGLSLSSTTFSSLNSNLVNGSATGSLRGINTLQETTGYTMGTNAFAEGESTTASGSASHAEGFSTRAIGIASHAGGQYSRANSNYSFAHGLNVVSAAQGQAVFGRYNEEDSDALFIIGNGTDNNRSNLMLVKDNSITIGKSSGAHSTIDANGQRFYAVDGQLLLANIGYGEGQAGSGTAIAPYYTFGVRDTDTSVVGNYSFAEGKDITATGYASHAEGVATGATAQGAHAEGDGSGALGRASHAEGYGTQASGNYSHSQNNRTIAQRQSQTALGEFNIADTSGSVSTRGKYSIIIGNGTSAAARSNALTVDWQGRIECGDYSGTLTSIFDIFYPVGSYYETSDTAFNPNTAWGGTWVLDSKGRVTVSRDENITDFDTIGETGGEKTHTLTVNEMPSHTHKDGTNASVAYVGHAGTNTAQVAFDANSGRPTTATGGGQAHNNMPPYVVVNRWHRTA